MTATIQKHIEGSVRNERCPAITDFEAECTCLVPAEIVSEQTTDMQIAEMRIELARLSTLIDAQVTLLNEIKNMVEPTLDSLYANPMVRMMLGGKTND